MSFGQLLTNLMRDKNITAYKMGKDTGISNRLITYWKDGERTPNAENLNKVADYFHVSVDYLLGKEQKNKPTNSNDELTADEHEFLDIVNRLSPRAKEELLRFARFQAEQEK